MAYVTVPSGICLESLKKIRSQIPSSAKNLNQVPFEYVLEVLQLWLSCLLHLNHTDEQQ
jgi:hypothetical protein